MTVRRSNLITAIVIAAIIATIGVLSNSSLNSFEASFNELLTHTVTHTEVLRDIRAYGTKLFSSVNEMVLAITIGSDPDDIAAERGEITGAADALRALTAKLSTGVETDPDPADVAPEEIIAAVDSLMAAAISVSETVETQGIEEIAELREEMEAAEETFEEVLIAALAGETELATRTQLDTVAALERTETILLITAVATPAVLLIAFYLLGDLQSNLLNRMVAQTNQISRGDYSARVTALRGAPAEMKALAENMNTLATTVQERESDLKQINETLERRVRERTREAEGARRIAEENNRLKSEFLATMSHELRTPLNAIEGFTSIIRNRMGGTDFNEKTGRYIERIEANSKRLLGLVNDFLDISRIESGRVQFASTPFSPAETAHKWASQIGVLADKKGIAFDLTLDPNLPDRIVGDEEAVSKMAINLLGNAIKFTETGKVSLDVRTAEGGQWQIRVQDTGIGIPPHAREYIFDEFRQVDQTSSRKYGGTGLGLTIVQKLARAMGGSVSLESEVGQGSTFTLTLPYQIAQPQAIPA
ncbi:MAG: hypothetical protein IPK19_11970 [Chloroflexi bacterium]|nr:hypothetical protein [Chloroflexota bacterium]